MLLYYKLSPITQRWYTVLYMNMQNTMAHRSKQKLKMYFKKQSHFFKTLSQQASNQCVAANDRQGITLQYNVLKNLPILIYRNVSICLCELGGFDKIRFMFFVLYGCLFTLPSYIYIYKYNLFGSDSLLW